MNNEIVICIRTEIADAKAGKAPKKFIEELQRALEIAELVTAAEEE